MDLFVSSRGVLKLFLFEGAKHGKGGEKLWREYS
jgi:hypothetical protein